MENLQSITLDIMNNKYADYIYTKQYDKNRIVDFTITENGTPLDASQIFCTFIMKYNGVVAIEFLERNQDGTFRLYLNQAETAQAGRIQYQLIATDQQLTLHPDGTIDWDAQPAIIGTVNGILLVEECVIDDEDAESQLDETMMDKLLEALSKAGSYITEARDSAVKSQSYAVGGTDFDHDGVDDDYDNSKYYYEFSKEYNIESKNYYEQNKLYYEKMTKYRLVTLVASDWSVQDLTQTVEVMGIDGDETKQLVTVAPKLTSLDDYVNYGIMAIEQNNNSLTFRCGTMPDVDIEVFVVAKMTELDKYATIPYSDFVYADEEPTDLVENDYWIQKYE